MGVVLIPEKMDKQGDKYTLIEDSIHLKAHLDE